MIQQLPLGIRLRDDATFDNFYSGENQNLVRVLQQQGEDFVFLFGNQGTGKTHLLQALCHLAAQQGAASIYLPLGEHDLVPAMLEGMESLPLVCLDDLQAVTGQAEWEEALFHLYNRCREQGQRLVIAAHKPIHSLGVRLADLQSRLSWGLVYQLQDLSDQEKTRVLQLRAQNRGMHLSDEVAEYLIKHSPRNLNQLFSLLDILDRESLAAQRRLTIPFVKQFLFNSDENNK